MSDKLKELEKILRAVRKEEADRYADRFEDGHVAGRKDLAFELLSEFFPEK